MLHHEAVGDGITRHTLLLHGFLGSGRNLHSLARRWSRLDPERHLTLVDLPGHGKSPAIAESDGLAELAEAVLDTAESLAPGPVEVVGHSHGGRVALAMARAAPEMLTRVTLLDIAPGPVTPQADLSLLVECLLAAPDGAESRDAMRAGFLEAGVSRPLADWLLMNLVRGEEGGLVWRIDREALARGRKRWGAEDLWEAVEDPATVVASCVRGERSGFVGAGDVSRLEAAGVAVHTLAGAGHFVHVDSPEPLVELLSTSA